MRFRIPDGKEKQGLIRVRQDDLFGVISMARESRERTSSGFHQVDAALSLANIGDEDIVANRYQIGSAAMALESAFDGRKEFSAILQLNREVLAICADNYTRQSVWWW